MKDNINNTTKKKGAVASSVKVEKRIKSVNNYFDSIRSVIRSVCSKTMAVRVDLQVKGKYQDYITITDVSNSMTKMLNNRRSNKTVFENMIGYVYIIEEGGGNSESNNPHVHFIGLFDGQKLKEDIYKSIQLGEHWSNNIMQGKGKYNSCNANKKNYKDYCLGTLDHKDDKGWDKLKEVSHYLCKDTQEPTDGNSRTRYFKLGVAPKKSKMGRPRKKA